jgi:drug/metabolite transporter (DMT)-like permease
MAGGRKHGPGLLPLEPCAAAAGGLRDLDPPEHDVDPDSTVLSWVFLGEQFTTMKLVAMALVFCGVLIVQLKM